MAEMKRTVKPDIGKNVVLSELSHIAGEGGALTTTFVKRLSFLKLKFWISEHFHLRFLG
jgi:hypothetical protein